MMPTKQEYECYSCGKETTQGQMRDLPYDEYIGQVFLCLECCKAEDRLMEEKDDVPILRE
jgi:hypothetical protein